MTSRRTVPPSSRLDAICLHAEDPALLAGYWSALLDRDRDGGPPTDLLPTGEDLPCRIRFLPTAEPHPGPNKVHLHLTSSSAADQDWVVSRAVELGGRHLDVGQLPEEGHIVLADPEGNAFCVIEPGNSFLAGCGFLGEIACDGSRAVGVFWSAALGWPLVWDEDDETAIQSPYGGTKIAWGGGPELPARERGGMHLDLTVAPGTDARTEIERLVGLGATLVATEETRTVLADPDGNTFRLLGTLPQQ